VNESYNGKSEFALVVVDPGKARSRKRLNLTRPRIPTILNGLIYSLDGLVLNTVISFPVQLLEINLKPKHLVQSWKLVLFTVS